MSFNVLNTKTDNYEAYAYSYPHKLAYRPFADPKSIKEVWQGQNLADLFLYVHIPYCEMRCGFCNLLTIANPKSGQRSYVDTMIDEMAVYTNELQDLHFQEYAIGGGTPTYLSTDELSRLLGAMNLISNNTLESLVGSIECSPQTIQSDKLSLLSDYQVNRLSMGIQSWIMSETRSLGRPQSPDMVEQSIKRIKDHRFEVLNLDLIYGIKDQTTQSFIYSLDKTLSYQPEEIFLYPLYIREQTGLGKKPQDFLDNRVALYQIGRDHLLNHGYQQISMRCFRKSGITLEKSNFNPTLNNTIGIGAGARSYTSNMNYSTPFAVKMTAIRSIIEQYSNQSKNELAQIKHGIVLDEQEQKIRFILKSLIDGGRLNDNDYMIKFASRPFDDFPILHELNNKNLIHHNAGLWQLTSQGMEHEDSIGPAFYSQTVKKQIQMKVL